MRFPTVHVSRRRDAYLVLGLVVAPRGRDLRRPRAGQGRTAGVVRASGELPVGGGGAASSSRCRATASRPAIVVVQQHGRGAAHGGRQGAAVSARAAELAPLAVGGRTAPPVYSQDGTVAVVVVPVDTSDDAAVGRRSPRSARWRRPTCRTASGAGDRRPGDHHRPHEGLRGRGHHAARRHRLHRRAAPAHHLPLALALARAARGRRVAEQVTTKLVALLAPHLGIVVDASAAGITSVLVFGAATDYALLLIARYRDRLRREDDRFHAMQVALRRTSEAIIASGLTVTLSLLALLLAQQETSARSASPRPSASWSRWCSGCSCCRRRWSCSAAGCSGPSCRTVGDEPREGRFWGRVGESVRRRPRLVGAGATGLLLVLALGRDRGRRSDSARTSSSA